MSGDDVSVELTFAKEAIERGHYDAAICAILRAEKAWRIECDLWQVELYEAEKAAARDVG